MAKEKKMTYAPLETDDQWSDSWPELSENSCDDGKEKHFSEGIKGVTLGGQECGNNKLMDQEWSEV